MQGHRSIHRLESKLRLGFWLSSSMFLVLNCRVANSDTVISPVEGMPVNLTLVMVSVGVLVAIIGLAILMRGSRIADSNSSIPQDSAAKIMQVDNKPEHDSFSCHPSSSTISAPNSVGEVEQSILVPIPGTLPKEAMIVSPAHDLQQPRPTVATPADSEAARIAKLLAVGAITNDEYEALMSAVR